MPPYTLIALDAGKPSVRLLEEEAKLRIDVASAEVISALTGAGIESILLKGPSIARWLYDEGESRVYGDVDLLVSPIEFEQAEEIAGRLGFKNFGVGDQLDEASRHTTWFREKDGVCLELHRGFMGITASDQEFWDELANDCERLPLGVLDTTAQIPGVAARTMLVGVHAATHGPVGSPLEDLKRALIRLPDEIWDEAATLARRLGAEPAFAVGLSYAPQGAEVVRRLGLNPAAPLETLLNTSVPPTTKGWEWLARAPGLKGKLRFALSKLAPPRDLMRLIDPIGQRGGMWLAVAYLVRPFRLARQAPRGFRVWRKLRRRAQ